MSATDLPDTITYWLPLSNNGTGGKTWSPGAAIPARVAHVAGEVFTPEGKTVRYNDAVYAETNVPPGGYVFIGDATGEAVPREADARLVIDTTSNPTMTTLARMVI